VPTPNTNRAEFPFVAYGLLALAVQDLRAAIETGQISIDAADDHKPDAVALLDRIDTLLREIDASNDAPEADRLHRLERFANRFLHPDDLGTQATSQMRDSARVALGQEPVEIAQD
jgi:hypothetical protein